MNLALRSHFTGKVSLKILHWSESTTDVSVITQRAGLLKEVFGKLHQLLLQKSVIQIDETTL